MVDFADYTACKRCGRLFRAIYCSPWCRRPRPPARRLVASEPRWCELCSREYMPTVWHQRFCSAACGVRVRDAVDRVRYRDQQRQRAVWRARVATGEVRCARGAACRFAEGELGGLIRPGQPWDLGHPDGESTGGAEHRFCNRSAPQRLKARRR